MSKLERLEKEKSDMIERQIRERQAMDDKIAREKEHIKRQKDFEKNQKRQQRQQNNSIEDSAYIDFVKASIPITEINNILEKFLNKE